MGHGGDAQVEFLDTVAESKIYLASAGSKATPISEAGVGIEGTHLWARLHLQLDAGMSKEA